MKRIIALASLLFVVATHAHAETKHFRGYGFEAYLVVDGHHRQWNARSYNVYAGQRYSIVVRNPLPVRVAAAVHVDGLNTIDGSDTTPHRAPKWIIEPYGSIEIDGWQTGDSSSRRFVFTRSELSYAKYREYSDGKHYTHRLGEIQISYFWDSRALRDATRPRPYSYSRRHQKNYGILSEDARSAPSAGRWDNRAGTGMGKHSYNPVRAVNFHFDTGMYAERNSLKLFYCFDHYREPYYAPRPFPYPQRRYAPEMP